MTSQIEKVNPAGTKRFGYIAEISPVVLSFMGRELARPYVDPAQSE